MSNIVVKTTHTVDYKENNIQKGFSLTSSYVLELGTLLQWTVLIEGDEHSNFICVRVTQQGLGLVRSSYRPGLLHILPRTTWTFRTTHTARLRGRGTRGSQSLCFRNRAAVPTVTWPMSRTAIKQFCVFRIWWPVHLGSSDITGSWNLTRSRSRGAEEGQERWNRDGAEERQATEMEQRGDSDSFCELALADFWLLRNANIW